MGFREDPWEENLARASRILKTGFGEKLAIGMLIGHLDPITPQRAWEYISENKNLFDNISEEEWEHYKKMVEGTRLSKFDTARVKLEINKRRNDLMQIMTNTPGGLEWIDGQVTRLREKLGLSTE